MIYLICQIKLKKIVYILHDINIAKLLNENSLASMKNLTFIFSHFSDQKLSNGEPGMSLSSLEKLLKASNIINDRNLNILLELIKPAVNRCIQLKDFLVIIEIISLFFIPT